MRWGSFPNLPNSLIFIFFQIVKQSDQYILAIIELTIPLMKQNLSIIYNNRQEEGRWGDAKI